MRMAPGCDSDRPNRSNDTRDTPDVSRPNPTREPQPVIVTLLVTMLFSLVAMCTVLMIPIVWVAITESAQGPKLTYQMCANLAENAARLACHDDVSRRTSVRPVKDARRMTFGELLGAQLHDQAPNASGTPKQP